MLILLIFISVLVVTFWKREYGLGAVIVLWPAYLIRTTIHGIPTTALEVSVYSLVVGFVIRAIVNKDLDLPKLPRWFKVCVAFWIVAWLLATAFSTDHQASLGAFKAWLIDPLLFGFVLLSTTQTTKQHQVILSSVALSGVIVALGGLVQMVWFRDSLQDGRLSSFFHPVANYAAMYLGPPLVMTTGALMKHLLAKRWWIAAGVMVMALALTVSFGGYLATGIGLLILWWKWPNKKMKRRSSIAAVIVAILGLAILSQTQYLTEKFKTTDRSSGLVRTQIWRTSMEIIKDHPLVGIGPNAYEKVYRTTIPKLYWPPLEWLVSQPHQLYLALWLETGLLGLITFVIFVVFWMRSLWPQVKSGESLATISLAAMAVILIHGFVDTPVFKNDLMMVFVVVIVLSFLQDE